MLLTIQCMFMPSLAINRRSAAEAFGEFTFVKTGR